MTTERPGQRRGPATGTHHGWTGSIFEHVIPPPPSQQAGADDGRAAHVDSIEEETVEIAGVYIISVAARLLEMHPQTLRKYERFGLIRPSRTAGSLRLYSDQDLARLRIVRRLVEELGLNLAGVRLLLEVVSSLRIAIEALEREADTRASPGANAAIAQLRAVLDFVDA